MNSIIVSNNKSAKFTNAVVFEINIEDNDSIHLLAIKMNNYVK